MSLTADERAAIINLKLAKCDNAYSEMLRNYELGMYSTAANRLYYALFYASSALLVNDGIEVHTHNGNLAQLNINYIKPGKLPIDFGKLIRNVFRLRQESDYDDYFQITDDEIKGYIAPAKDFIDTIKNLIALKTN